MGRILEPSDVIRALMHRHKEDLARVRGQRPLGRCYDCGRYIPRDELPMRCPECSGPTTVITKTYPRKFHREDAMICLHCMDKHDHLKQIVMDIQQGVYDANKHAPPIQPNPTLKPKQTPRIVLH